MPRLLRTAGPVLAGAITFFGVAALDAQAAPSGQPRIAVDVRPTVSKLSAWPGMSITLDRDAWVTAMAVSRGSQSLPVQVLSPVEPGKPAFIKAGQRVPLRRLESRETLHLVNYGEAPVVVVFASNQPPDLSVFADGARWGHDLLLGNTVSNQQAMVELLGTTIFGYATPYTAEVRSTAEPMPLTRTASVWSFDNSCAGVSAGWERQIGPNGAGLVGNWGDVDPSVRILAGQSTAVGDIVRMANGAPVELKGGSRVSILPPTVVGASACRGYRVAWWPQVDRPLPTDTVSRGSAIVSPRYPDVSAPVGTVPGSRDGGDRAIRSEQVTPRIIVDPREASRDAQAIRSLQGVARPSSDGSVRPPGGA